MKILIVAELLCAHNRNQVSRPRQADRSHALGLILCTGTAGPVSHQDCSKVDASVLGEATFIAQEGRAAVETKGQQAQQAAIESISLESLSVLKNDGACPAANTDVECTGVGTARDHDREAPRRSRIAANLAPYEQANANGPAADRADMFVSATTPMAASAFIAAEEMEMMHEEHAGVHISDSDFTAVPSYHHSADAIAEQMAVYPGQQLLVKEVCAVVSPPELVHSADTRMHRSSGVTITEQQIADPGQHQPMEQVCAVTSSSEPYHQPASGVHVADAAEAAKDHANLLMSATPPVVASACFAAGENVAEHKEQVVTSTLPTNSADVQEHHSSSVTAAEQKNVDIGQHQPMEQVCAVTSSSEPCHQPASGVRVADAAEAAEDHANLLMSATPPVVASACFAAGENVGEHKEQVVTSTLPTHSADVQEHHSSSVAAAEPTNMDPGQQAAKQVVESVPELSHKHAPCVHIADVANPVRDHANLVLVTAALPAATSVLPESETVVACKACKEQVRVACKEQVSEAVLTLEPSGAKQHQSLGVSIVEGQATEPQQQQSTDRAEEMTLEQSAQQVVHVQAPDATESARDHAATVDAGAPMAASACTLEQNGLSHDEQPAASSVTHRPNSGKKHFSLGAALLGDQSSEPRQLQSEESAASVEKGSQQEAGLRVVGAAEPAWDHAEVSAGAAAIPSVMVAAADCMMEKEKVMSNDSPGHMATTTSASTEREQGEAAEARQQQADALERMTEPSPQQPPHVHVEDAAEAAWEAANLSLSAAPIATSALIPVDKKTSACEDQKASTDIKLHHPSGDGIVEKRATEASKQQQASQLIVIGTSPEPTQPQHMNREGVEQKALMLGQQQQPTQAIAESNQQQQQERDANLEATHLKPKAVIHTSIENAADGSKTHQDHDAWEVDPEAAGREQHASQQSMVDPGQQASQAGVEQKDIEQLQQHQAFRLGADKRPLVSCQQPEGEEAGAGLPAETGSLLHSETSSVAEYMADELVSMIIQTASMLESESSSNVVHEYQHIAQKPPESSEEHLAHLSTPDVDPISRASISELVGRIADELVSEVKQAVSLSGGPECPSMEAVQAVTPSASNSCHSPIASPSLPSHTSELMEQVASELVMLIKQAVLPTEQQGMTSTEEGRTPAHATGTAENGIAGLENEGRDAEPPVYAADKAEQVLEELVSLIRQAASMKGCGAPSGDSNLRSGDLVATYTDSQAAPQDQGDAMHGMHSTSERSAAVASPVAPPDINLKRIDSAVAAASASTRAVILTSESLAPHTTVIDHGNVAQATYLAAVPEPVCMHMEPPSLQTVDANVDNGTAASPPLAASAAHPAHMQDEPSAPDSDASNALLNQSPLAESASIHRWSTADVAENMVNELVSLIAQTSNLLEAKLMSSDGSMRCTTCAVGDQSGVDRIPQTAYTAIC
jgi:hypothetical protein